MCAFDKKECHMSEGRVLVVDDDADVRKSVRLILSKAGYDVVEAEDPSFEFIPSAHAAAEDECPSVGRNHNQTVLIADPRDALVNAERF